MPVLGLTGGIASGKSTVAGMMQTLGALVIDADQVAREVVGPGRPALDQIRERFGPAVMRADGTLDRKALGKMVFADAGARAELNSITHPRILREIRNWLASGDPGRFRVVEASLLVESTARHTGLPELQALIVVSCPAHEQLRRLAGRGLTPAEAQQMVAAQAGSHARLAVADFVIDNAASLEELGREVERVWALILDRFS